MSTKVTAYDLLISCPSDVMEYVQKIENEVDRFNNFFGRSNNIVVRLGIGLRMHILSSVNIPKNY